MLADHSGFDETCTLSRGEWGLETAIQSFFQTAHGWSERTNRRDLCLLSEMIVPESRPLLLPRTLFYVPHSV
jgi:hypothetical protein